MMWLSEMEKGMTVWMYGLVDTWNVYCATVIGWTSDKVFLETNDGLRYSRHINDISASVLDPRPAPLNYIPPEGQNG